MFQVFLDDYKTNLLDSDDIRIVEKQFPVHLVMVGILLTLVLVYIGVQVIAFTLNLESYGLSTILLVVILVFSIVAIIRVDKQGRSLKEESIWKHQVRIVVLKRMLEEKKYTLNGQAGVEWLIEECRERLDNTSIGNHSRSTLNRSFDKIVYPIIAFLCGYISNYLAFSKVLGEATTVVSAIGLSVLILVMIFPVALDLMNQDLYALDILLDDLLYLKGSEDYNDLK